MKDALKRRKRDAPPQSKGIRLNPTPRDILICHKIFQHGPLSSTMLYELTRHLARDPQRCDKRLTDLYNESDTPHGGTYLARPAKQWESMDARYQDAIYTLTPRAEQLLSELGLLAAFERPHTHSQQQFRHSAMSAHITASIELACAQDRTLRFISEQEIMAHSPNKTRAIPCTVRHPSDRSEIYKGVVIPDAIFGIEFVGKGKRYYFLEADRGTETIWPLGKHPLKDVSYLRKVLQYREVIGNGVYKDFFGITGGVVVLNVVTILSRLKEISSVIGEVSNGTGSTYMLFNCMEQFGHFFKVPPPTPKLLTMPWPRVGHPKFYLNQ